MPCSSSCPLTDDTADYETGPGLLFPPSYQTSQHPVNCYILTHIQIAYHLQPYKPLIWEIGGLQLLFFFLDCLKCRMMSIYTCYALYCLNFLTNIYYLMIYFLSLKPIRPYISSLGVGDIANIFSLCCKIYLRCTNTLDLNLNFVMIHCSPRRVCFCASNQVKMLVRHLPSPEAGSVF